MPRQITEDELRKTAKLILIVQPESPTDTILWDTEELCFLPKGSDLSFWSSEFSYHSISRLVCEAIESWLGAEDIEPFRLELEDYNG